MGFFYMLGLVHTAAAAAMVQQVNEFGTQRSRCRFRTV